MTDQSVPFSAAGVPAAEAASYRLREVRRGEFAQEVHIADSSIPGSGLFFSTDNEMMIAARRTAIEIGTEGATLDAQWATGNVGSGTATQTGGELVLAPGATADSRARVTSTRSAHRRGGSTQYYISVWRVDAAGTADNVRRFGVYDDNDGFFFEIRADGLYVGSRKAGVDTIVAPAAQNGPLLGSTLDLTKMNQFNLFYGGLSCRWQVNGRVLHAIGAGVPSSPLTARLSVPLRAESVNTNGQTANAQLFGRGVSFHRVSPVEMIPRFLNIDGAATTVVQSGAGTLQRIVVNESVAGTVTVFDNTAASGTTIATMVTIGSGQPFDVAFNTEFGTGLTVVTSAAGHNVTIVFD